MTAHQDPRLQIADSPRPAPPPSKELPLVTIAWRSLRAEHQRRAGERRLWTDEVERLEAAAVTVADECFRLRKTLAGQAATEGPWAAVAAAVPRLEAALAALGVRILAPVGEPYVGELLSLLDNAAQRAGEGAEPVVAETLVPAVLRGQRLLRGGKAVIATARTEGGSS
jgi:hypothetical protein